MRCLSRLAIVAIRQRHSFRWETRLETRDGNVLVPLAYAYSMPAFVRPCERQVDDEKPWIARKGVQDRSNQWVASFFDVTA